MRTLIKNGTIVNADATTRADVLVDGEKIALIGSDLAGDGVHPNEAGYRIMAPLAEKAIAEALGRKGR